MSRDEAIALSAARGLGGGYLQRHARGQSSHRMLHDSPLPTSLVETWSMGLISAPCVQKLASSGVEELRRAGVTPHPILLALASVGTNGEYPGNTRRDLMIRYPVSPQLPKPVLVDVPTLVVPAGGSSILPRSRL